LGDGDGARIVVRLDKKNVIHWQGMIREIGPDDSITQLPNQDEQVVFGFGAQQDMTVELHEFDIQKMPSNANAQDSLRTIVK